MATEGRDDEGELASLPLREQQRLARFGDGVVARFQVFKERHNKSLLPVLDDGSTAEEWDERARLLGASSGQSLKEQMRLARETYDLFWPPTRGQQP